MYVRGIGVSDAGFAFVVVEEKKHKLTELKTGLDEADSLVFVVLTCSLNLYFLGCTSSRQVVM